jgi:DNA modification methylase
MNKFGHPAMFPEELAKRVIKLFSFKGDIVLDPFNGVGTTTKVAKQYDRHYLGIDISNEYCNIAEKRLREITKLDKFFNFW